VVAVKCCSALHFSFFYIFLVLWNQLVKHF
jgi:hypothetical protein